MSLSREALLDLLRRERDPAHYDVNLWFRSPEQDEDSKEENKKPSNYFSLHSE